MGFRRPVFVRPPRAPLRVTEAFRVGEPVGDLVVAVPKLFLLRSESYRRWVASLPCSVCGLLGFSQCAHSNQAKHGKAGAQKAGDQFTFPLCCVRGGFIGHHQEHDLLIDMTKDERDENEDRYIVETWAKARAAGRPEILQLEAA